MAAALKENQGFYTLILSGVSVIAMALMMFSLNSLHTDVKDGRKDITTIRINQATQANELQHQAQLIDLNTQRARRQWEVINEHHRTDGVETSKQ